MVRGAHNCIQGERNLKMLISGIEKRLEKIREEIKKDGLFRKKA